ncbi:MULTISPECIES: Mur ligase family protein [unclassified Curtobacterium]|uniref:Mur ligase family protein n=1 Tax=unclassified Curtobacterium TaxID=257496 RepID=UPI00226BB69B|nr:MULTISPECIES: UDP-N-acetylmuramyl-tripeptide synthetase [unclassified Curtobacterium]
MPHAFDPEHLRPVSLRAVADAVGGSAVGGSAVGATASAGDVLVTGLTVSTGDVLPGVLFAALPGRHQHGADHVDAARRAGAVAVLTDTAGQPTAAASGLPVVVVPDVRTVLGAAARAVYGTDDLGVPMLGVTGTNGKTSTVYVLDALMRRLGWPTALTSTAERRVRDDAVAARLTTPEAPELHAFLARAAEQGVRGIAVEASAQGLSRHRLDGVRFDVAGFTNLSHDHLDDYADMDTYLRAKAALFTPEHARRGVVSVDSAAGRTIVRDAGIPVETITSLPGQDAPWRVAVLDQRLEGTRFRLTGPDGTDIVTEVPLLGRHMAADTGLAMAMLIRAGVEPERLRAAMGDRLEVVVPGRMSDASAPTGPRVFVDFAHTPDAFAKSLEAVRAVAPARVAIVLGADGDRDPTKRHGMGVVAATAADVVVVADHHPRFEDPAPIRAAILAGARSVGSAAIIVEEPDPATAIRTALAAIGDDGVVYWAGPGLTDYRDVRGEHVPYSSFEDARVALAEAGHPAEETVPCG